MSLTFNDSYLNKSENKDARPALLTSFAGAIWHETAGGGALEYNLSRSVLASYNHLIARADAQIYHYIDEKAFIAYGAGLAKPNVPAVVTVDGRTYRGYEINVHFLNVEVEGPNDGTPCTEAQKRAIAQLMVYFRDTYGIPLDKAHHIGHVEIAPGYKTDPRGYSVAERLQAAAQLGAGSTTLQTFNPAQRYRLIQTANVRRIPEMRQDAILIELPAGTGVAVSSIAQGQAVGGNDRWALISGLGYVHTSLLEPEDAPARVDSATVLHMRACLAELGAHLDELERAK